MKKVGKKGEDTVSQPDNPSGFCDIQLENGYFRIANAWFDIFSCTSLSDWEWRIVHSIVRMTYGFNKKEDKISLSQLSDLTKIPRKKIPRIIQRLEAKKIIHVNRTGYVTKFSLSKVSPTWGTVSEEKVSPVWGTPENQSVPCMGDESVPHVGDESVPCMGDYKRHKDKRHLEFFEKNSVSKKFMNYQERTIELDENGDEIQSVPVGKKKYPAKMLKSLGLYYMHMFHLEGNVVRYYKYLKEMIDLSRNIHSDDELVEQEIKARLDIVKKYCEVKEINKIKITTIIENWNIILKDWRKEVNI